MSSPVRVRLGRVRYMFKRLIVVLSRMCEPTRHIALDIYRWLVGWLVGWLAGWLVGYMVCVVCSYHGTGARTVRVSG